MVARIYSNEVERRREELRMMPHCTFLDPDEFRVMAISLKRLARCDDHQARVRGLVDSETGESFFTEEEKLYA